MGRARALPALGIAVLCAAGAARACDSPICVVSASELRLTMEITFEDQLSGMGPGTRIDDVLDLPGARFGERFAGQKLVTDGSFDRVEGGAFSPLTVVPGASGQSLSVVRMAQNNVLNGYGAAGFPKREAQGEGAIAVLFDADQAAFSLELRGGEAGSATLQVLRRDGQVIDTLTISPIGEHPFGFLRAGGVKDIAGFVLTCDDPQGIALDNLRFEPPPNLG